jgi:hypothetical protein
MVVVVVLFPQMVGHFMKNFETDPAASSARKTYSTMHVTVLMKRQHGWFLQNVILLIGLLLCYDWFTFLLPAVSSVRIFFFLRMLIKV